MEQDRDLVDLNHDVGEEELVTVCRRHHPLFISLVVLLLSLSLPTSLVQIYARSKGKIVSFNLPDGLVDEGMEARQCLVVECLGTAIHKIECKGNLVCLVELCLSLFTGMQHLYNHNLGQTILMHTAWPLMHEHIIENLGKAVHAVFERDGRVKPEQRQVEISASLVVRDYDRSLGALYLVARRRLVFALVDLFAVWVFDRRLR